MQNSIIKKIGENGYFDQLDEIYKDLKQLESIQVVERSINRVSEDIKRNLETHKTYASNCISYQKNMEDTLKKIAKHISEKMDRDNVNILKTLNENLNILIDGDLDKILMALKIEKFDAFDKQIVSPLHNAFDYLKNQSNALKAASNI